MQKVIDIRNGVARHPQYRLKAPVTLSLDDGECVAIVGRNGSGKSMLVDMLTGRHPLLGDEVRYDFRPSTLPMVSDNVKLLTFRDCFGTSDGTYYHQQRWNQWDLDDQKDRDVRVLSSGEMRRRLLNQVLEKQPRVLVLDNPFIGLDAEARRYFSDLLARTIAERPLLLVLVLSKTDDMPDFVTHVVEVKDGGVEAKVARSVWLATHVPDEVLSPEKRAAIESLPVRDDDFARLPAGQQRMIELHDVHIRYGERTILEGLNWSVMNGEHWALGGGNGSGKSTLLSIVCADNPQAYANDVELFGFRRGRGESIWDIKRHIGYVSPELHRAYLKDVPAVEVVASGLSDAVGLYKRPKAEQMPICEFWMDVFGVLWHRDTSFLNLSSGEQRLVLLARAFVKDPSLLILDEPMHGLDLCNRRLVQDVIEAFCRRGSKTLIMVTHYVDELPACIDHHIVLTKK